jgi:hypothetical protein
MTTCGKITRTAKSQYDVAKEDVAMSTGVDTPVAAPLASPLPTFTMPAVNPSPRFTGFPSAPQFYQYPQPAAFAYPTVGARQAVNVPQMANAPFSPFAARGQQRVSYGY